MQARGFSLIELLIVMALAAILLAMGVPAFISFFHNTQDDIARQQLVRAIHTARNEAALRHQTVFLIQRADGKAYTISTNKKVLYSFAIETGVLHWKAFEHHVEILQFLPTGLSNADNGTFWYCRHAANPRWAVVVNKAGRDREVFPDANGKISNAEGRQLNC